MNPRSLVLAIAFALSASITLSACDRISSLTVEEHIQRAKDHEGKNEYKSALIELKNAIGKSPDNTQARLLLGQIYLETGDGVSAEKELTRAKELGVTESVIAVPLANALMQQGKLREALERLSSVTGLTDSGMAELHVTRGKAYIGLGDAQHAEEAFKAASEAKPDAPAAWEGQALLAYSKQQWEEAARWNEKILSGNPNSVKALALKGDIALARDDAKTAEAAYGSAVKLRPDYLQYRIGLAIAQIGNSKPAEAKTQLNTVLKVVPNHPTANYYRALAAYQLKEYESAKTHSENAINSQAQGDLRSRLLAAAANYALGQTEAAYKHIQLVTAGAPSYEPARMLQAAILLKMGQAGQAAENIKGVTQVSEKDLKLLNAVGLAALQQGKSAVGLELFQRAVQAHPDDPLARARLGIARSAKGDYQAAIEDYEQALRLNPKLVGTEALIAMNHLRAGNADDALKAALRLQQGLPGHPDGYTLAGLAHVMKKQYPEARTAFNKAISIQPGNPNASHNLASLALLDGKPDQARKLYQSVIQKFPGHVQSIVRLAELDLQAGQPKQAEKTLKDAATRNPAVMPLQLALGNFYLAQQKPAMALKLAEETLPRFPEDPSLLMLQGIAQLQSGQPDLAVSALEKAVKVAPNDPNSHLQLARAHEQSGNLIRASQELQATLKLAPGHGPAKFAQARLLARSGKPDASQKLLAELAASYPNDPKIIEVRGDLAIAQNKAKDAAGFYRAALAKGESNFLTVKLAASQIASGDPQAGHTTLRNWLKRYPDDVHTRGALADALLAAGKLDEASEHYTKNLDRQPKNVSTLNNLAWISLETGAIDQAMTYAQRAYKLAPKQPQVLDTYAMIFMRKGNATEAINKLREAQALASGNSMISLHLAQALIAGNQPAQARTVLRELLSRKIALPHKQQAEELLKSIH